MRSRTAEQAMSAWQQRWEAFTREGNEAGQKAMVERARIEHLDSRLRRTLVQQEKVQVERDALAALDSGETIAALVAREAAARRGGPDGAGAPEVAAR